ncbi:MAG: hypothetical protein QM765_49455 [Myxococcales bacterium]
MARNPTKARKPQRHQAVSAARMRLSIITSRTPTTSTARRPARNERASRLACAARADSAMPPTMASVSSFWNQGRVSVTVKSPVEGSPSERRAQARKKRLAHREIRAGGPEVIDAKNPK